MRVDLPPSPPGLDPAPAQPAPVDLLILGAGWSSTFLLPLLRREGVAHAATTTDGRGGTIGFRFDPASSDPRPFARLPRAATVLITFPLKGEGPARRLVELYAATHPPINDGGGDSSDGESSAPPPPPPPRWIIFGVTSVWSAPTWQDDTSPYDREAARAVAEDELMAVTAPRGAQSQSQPLPPLGSGAAVLSLAGLYGASRQPRDWVDRVVRSRAELAAKGALHVVHGEDVARAVLALHRDFTPGARWMLTDLHVYDWWDLAQAFAAERLRGDAEARRQKKQGAGDGGGGGDDDDDDARLLSDDAADRQRQLIAWVGELMEEKGVRGLPRDTSSLGRALDGRNFWNRMGIWPSRGRIA